MKYTLSTLKGAVLAAATASSKPGFEGEFTTSQQLRKAVATQWPDDTNDARTRGYWLGLATYFGIDNQPWKDAKTTKTKLTDIKTEVLAHYEVSDTKALKAKLKDWGILHGKLTTRQAWEELLAGCKASRRGKVVELAEPLEMVA
ncbi:hypothetical protein [Acaryochloris sp. IP29b_bin.137]|uniref:hypothetical protein n=1 Tax=Acaryochloris sp. IP29b_bin.137 TaxID=2969217 RepID=UPI0026383511|nr:hypothetical protein [Acaryochloris sp. IP29b_bin.137]